MVCFGFVALSPSFCVCVCVCVLVLLVGNCLLILLSAPCSHYSPLWEWRTRSRFRKYPRRTSSSATGRNSAGEQAGARARARRPFHRHVETPQKALKNPTAHEIGNKEQPFAEIYVVIMERERGFPLSFFLFLFFLVLLSSVCILFLIFSSVFSFCWKG